MKETSTYPEEDKTPGPPITGSTSCRESAMGVLTKVFERADNKAAAIAVLLKVIPWRLLSKEDDELLWDYFCSMR